MTGLEAVGVGLGFLAIVAPEFWPKMPRALSYTLAGIGLSWLTYSAILLIEESTHMKLQQGPLGAIIVGALFVAGGLFWHISRVEREGGEEGAAPKPSPGILLDFAYDTLPRGAPPEGNVYGFEIREEGGAIQAGPITFQFNPNQIIDWRPFFPQWPIFGISKCEITSTTNEPVFYAVVPIKLVFRELVPETGQPYQVGEFAQSMNGVQMRSGAVVATKTSSLKVDKIYSQNPYAIYFVNLTKYRVDVEVPSEGKVQGYSKTGADFEQKISMKLGRTTGLVLSPTAEAFKFPPALHPQAPSPPNTPEKK